MFKNLSGTGKCCDNAGMESFFTTLKNEKLYNLPTYRLSKEKVITAIRRFIFAYHITIRVSNFNPGGIPPVRMRENPSSLPNHPHLWPPFGKMLRLCSRWQEQNSKICAALRLPSFRRLYHFSLSRQGKPPVTPTSDSGNLKTFACHFGCFPTGLILTFPVLILWLYRTGSLLIPYNWLHLPSKFLNCAVITGSVQKFSAADHSCAETA